MTDTSVKLSNPIDPAKAQTLVRLETLGESLETPMLVVGAFARDINFWHMGDLAAPSTRELVLPMLRAEITSHSRCPLAHRLSEEMGKGSFARARQIIGAMIKGMEKG